MDEYFQRTYAYQDQSGGEQVALLDALKDFLESKIEAGAAAARVASFVFSKSDFFPAYEHALGYYSCITGAASAIHEEQYLRKLAELVLALS